MVAFLASFRHPPTGAWRCSNFALVLVSMLLLPPPTIFLIVSTFFSGRSNGRHCFVPPEALVFSSSPTSAYSSKKMSLRGSGWYSDLLYFGGSCHRLKRRSVLTLVVFFCLSCDPALEVGMYPDPLGLFVVVLQPLWLFMVLTLVVKLATEFLVLAYCRAFGPFRFVS